jgi:hypothetical protein
MTWRAMLACGGAYHHDKLRVTSEDEGLDDAVDVHAQGVAAQVEFESRS